MEECPECGEPMEEMEEQKFCCEDCGCFVWHEGNAYHVESPDD